MLLLKSAPQNQSSRPNQTPFYHFPQIVLCPQASEKYFWFIWIYLITLYWYINDNICHASRCYIHWALWMGGGATVAQISTSPSLAVVACRWKRVYCLLPNFFCHCVVTRTHLVRLAAHKESQLASSCGLKFFSQEFVASVKSPIPPQHMCCIKKTQSFRFCKMHLNPPSWVSLWCCFLAPAGALVRIPWESGGDSPHGFRERSLIKIRGVAGRGGGKYGARLVHQQHPILLTHILPPTFLYFPIFETHIPFQQQ